MITSLNSGYFSVKSLKVFCLAGSKRFCSNNKNLIQTGFTDTKLKIIYHKFSNEEAAEIFAKHDAKRIFAPKHTTGHLHLQYPLKKVFLPFVGVDTISEGDYKAKYGITNVTTVSIGKGQVIVIPNTSYYNTKGYLEKKFYTEADKGFKIYTGYTWDNELLEDSMTGSINTQDLQPFDPETLAQDAEIDPFLMDKHVAEDIFRKCIYDYEKNRASQDIYKREWSSDVKNLKLNLKYETKVKCYLLPAFILQYPGNPPRILPALDREKVTVFGANPISVPKTMAASLILGALFSAALPQVAIPLAITSVIGTSALTGIFAKYRLAFKNDSQIGKMIERKKVNQTAILSRFDFQKMKIAEVKLEKIEAPLVIKATPSLQKYLKVLGIKEDEALTTDKINAAYEDSNRNVKGSSRELIALYQDTLEAKKLLLDFVKKASSNKE